MTLPATAVHFLPPYLHSVWRCAPRPGNISAEEKGKAVLVGKIEQKIVPVKEQHGVSWVGLMLGLETHGGKL
ncbi:hypothetical protein E2C01_010494 [Portunus trituberculatus]|uniref:Uncharacterized protein n=1 Tax=Portunus trituberculatus TaxID=210409 RepID=A0A5B7D8I7_PORTR|nr:hypothetical protein [Portunus trituberculatus]